MINSILFKINPDKVIDKDPLWVYNNIPAKAISTQQKDKLIKNVALKHPEALVTYNKHYMIRYYELARYTEEWLIDNRPETFCALLPRKAALKYPCIAATHNGRALLDHNPQWLAVNKPATLFKKDPELSVEINLTWTILFHPEYVAIKHPHRMTKGNRHELFKYNPEFLIKNDPEWVFRNYPKKLKTKWICKYHPEYLLKHYNPFSMQVIMTHIKENPLLAKQLLQDMSETLD